MQLQDPRLGDVRSKDWMARSVHYESTGTGEFEMVQVAYVDFAPLMNGSP